MLLCIAAASSLNAFLMRRHELKEGIEVVDADGKVVGTSQVAAKHVSNYSGCLPHLMRQSILIMVPVVNMQAVRDTVITRMVLPAPLLTIPPVVMALLER